jgi:hypothetical protein
MIPAVARHRGFSHAARVAGGKTRGHFGARDTKGRYLHHYGVTSGGMQGILRHASTGSSGIRASKHKQIISIDRPHLERIRAERSLLGRRGRRGRVFGKKYRVHVEKPAPLRRYKKWDLKMRDYGGF